MHLIAYLAQFADTNCNKIWEVGFNFRKLYRKLSCFSDLVRTISSVFDRDAQIYRLD